MENSDVRQSDVERHPVFSYNNYPNYGKILSDRSLQNLKQVESTLAQIQSRLFRAGDSRDDRKLLTWNFFWRQVATENNSEHFWEKFESLFTHALARRKFLWASDALRRQAIKPTTHLALKNDYFEALSISIESSGFKWTNQIIRVAFLLNIWLPN